MRYVIDFLIDLVIQTTLYAGVVWLAWLIYSSSIGHALLCDTGGKVCGP